MAEHVLEVGQPARVGRAPVAQPERRAREARLGDERGHRRDQHRQRHPPGETNQQRDVARQRQPVADHLEVALDQRQRAGRGLAPRARQLVVERRRPRSAAASSFSRLLEDADVEIDPQAQPDQLAHQPEHALAAGHRRHRAELQRDQPHRRSSAAARPARHRRVRGDDGVDDQLADPGDERRQRGRDDREARPARHAARRRAPHQPERARRMRRAGGDARRERRRGRRLQRRRDHGMAVHASAKPNRSSARTPASDDREICRAANRERGEKSQRSRHSKRPSIGGITHMKRLGLISVLGLALIAAPGAALAAGGFHGGGGGGFHGGGFRAVVVVDSTAVDFAVVVVVDPRRWISRWRILPAGVTTSRPRPFTPRPAGAIAGSRRPTVAASRRSIAARRSHGHGVAPGYGYRYAPVYGHVGVVRPVAPLWVPGYWGWNSGVGSGIGGSWGSRHTPAGSGCRAHWAWNGYQWVWQSGQWAPPDYSY